MQVTCTAAQYTVMHYDHWPVPVLCLFSFDPKAFLRSYFKLNRSIAVICLAELQHPLILLKFNVGYFSDVGDFRRSLKLASPCVHSRFLAHLGRE